MNDKMKVLIWGFVLSVVVKECYGEPGIYLINPPGATTGASEAQSMEPAESLWIGSHRINWSPLPLFLKFTNPDQYRVYREQYAQARKLDARPQKIIVAKKTINNFHFDPDINTPKPSYYSPPTHYTGKYIPNSLGSRFPEFPSRPQLPQPYLDQRSVSVSSHHQTYDSSTLENRHEVTTPSPIYMSTSATMLVSPPEAVEALATPGPNISPIVEKLRKMTEWTRHNKFLKKEGRPTPVYPYHERKLRPNPKKKFNPEIQVKVQTESPAQSTQPALPTYAPAQPTYAPAPSPAPKRYKNNIAEIIQSDDNEDINQSPSPSNDRAQIIKPKRLKEEKISNKPKAFQRDYLTKDYEDFRPAPNPHPTPRNSNSDLVIIHPTNAAFMIKDPLHSPRTKKQNFARRDKKLNFFKKEGTFNTRSFSSPLTFRFGPEDAKPFPYRL